MRWIVICLMWVFSGFPLAAQDDATVRRMASAFKEWTQAHGVSAGGLAIWYKGKPVATHAVGVAANTPMEMASLSKAVFQ